MKSKHQPERPEVQDSWNLLTTIAEAIEDDVETMGGCTTPPYLEVRFRGAHYTVSVTPGRAEKRALKEELRSGKSRLVCELLSDHLDPVEADLSSPVSCAVAIIMKLARLEDELRFAREDSRVLVDSIAFLVEKSRRETGKKPPEAEQLTDAAALTKVLAALDEFLGQIGLMAVPVGSDATSMSPSDASCSVDAEAAPQDQCEESGEDYLGSVGLFSVDIPEVEDDFQEKDPLTNPCGWVKPPEEP